MIKPTVGRVVWYIPPGWTEEQQPLCAHISYVHDDGTINAMIIRKEGVPYLSTPSNIPLIQGDEKPPEGGGFCMWMPYQTEQAKKHSDESRVAMQSQIDELKKMVLELLQREQNRMTPPAPANNEQPGFTPPPPVVG